jgi:hypothetical protein
MARRNAGARRPYGERGREGWGQPKPILGAEWRNDPYEGASARGDWSYEGPNRGAMGTSRGPKGYKRADERIREEICDRLLGETGIDASEIDIQVKNGEVMLSGTVQHRDDKRRVEDLVDRVLGVKDVHNQLRKAATTAGATGGGAHSNEPAPAERTRKRETVGN